MDDDNDVQITTDSNNNQHWKFSPFLPFYNDVMIDNYNNNINKHYNILPFPSLLQVWSRLCPPQPEPSRLAPRPQVSPPPLMRLVYAGGGAPCHTPTTLVLKQQPAGAHNLTVFQGTVCLGGESWGRVWVTSGLLDSFFSKMDPENGEIQRERTLGLHILFPNKRTK